MKRALSEKCIIMPVYASLPISKMPGTCLCRGQERAGQSELEKERENKRALHVLK